MNHFEKRAEDTHAPGLDQRANIVNKANRLIGPRKPEKASQSLFIKNYNGNCSSHQDAAD